MTVEFNDEGQGFGQRDFGTQKTPKLAGWLISKGLAKNIKAANAIQLIAALVFFALALYFAL